MLSMLLDGWWKLAFILFFPPPLRFLPPPLPPPPPLLPPMPPLRGCFKREGGADGEAGVCLFVRSNGGGSRVVYFV